MKSKGNVISLQIKNLVYVCEDDEKENLLIMYSDEKDEHIKIKSIDIPLDLIEAWWEE